MAISQTSQLLRDAGTAMVNTAEHLGTNATAISDEMKAWRSTATATIRSMGDIVPNIERVTSELAEAAGAINLVAREQFGRAATRHQESAEVFARSVEQIRESAEQLNGQLNSFSQMVSAQATAGQEWSRSLQKDLVPAQQSFRQAGSQLVDATKDLVPAQQAFGEAVDAMRGSANGLAALVREGVEPATRRLEELDQVLGRMQEATEAMRQTAQLRQEFVGLAKSLSQAAAAADAIRSLPQEIRVALQTIVLSHNGNNSPRRPFLRRLFGGFASNGRTHGKP
jgi:methyl-accepting chemotaxis protein